MITLTRNKNYYNLKCQIDNAVINSESYYRSIHDFLNDLDEPHTNPDQLNELLANIPRLINTLDYLRTTVLKMQELHGNP